MCVIKYSFLCTHSWHWYRRAQLCRDYASYFPINLVKEGDLDPRNNYVIGSHPHGMFAFGASCNFGTDGTNVSKTFPGITFFIVTLPCQFKWHFYRNECRRDSNSDRHIRGG